MSIFRSIVAAGLLSSAAVYGGADVNLTDSAFLDDFNDDYGDAPNQNTLGAVYGISSLGSSWDGGGYWYVFQDTSGSSVTNSEKEQIVASTNEATLVLDSTMHVFLSSKSTDPYPFAGVGCNLVDKSDAQDKALVYVDLTEMTSLTMRVKGTGKVRVYFETKDFVTKSYNWGFYGKEITLTSSWTPVNIPTSQLLPEKDSPASTAKWVWTHGCTAVGKIAFGVKNLAEAELYVDDIKFAGMTYADCKFPAVRVNSYKAVKGPNMFNVNASSISFKLAQAQDLTVSLNDIMGNQIRSLYTGKTASETINLNDKNLASGRYLVVVSGKNVNYSQSIVVTK